MTRESRRNFLKSAGVGLSMFGWTAPSIASGGSRDRADWPDGVGLPAGWRELRKLDAHSHVDHGLARNDADWSSVEDLIGAADALGIDKLYCSRPITGGVLATVEQVREANDSVLAAMNRYPERIEGYCFLQPGHAEAALDELERCLDAGMIGVKLYNQFKYTNPVVFPIAERCIERRVPILGHSAYLTDARSLAAQPRTSHALDFCALSSRYPELMLILGHVNGGGDWEWAIKGLRNCPRVYVDTSGSVQEDDTVGRCVRELGEERVLFATDLTMEGGVGKVLSADLTEQQREHVFHRNFQRILDRRRS